MGKIGRWLKPGGAILPDRASLHMAAAGGGATGLKFWNKVYRFDFSLVQKELKEDAHQTALLKDVSSQDLLSQSCLLRQLDIAHMAVSDASFSTDFLLEADPEVCDSPMLYKLSPAFAQACGSPRCESSLVLFSCCCAMPMFIQ